MHLFCNLSQVYPAVLLMYFISAAVILLASLAITVQVSLNFINLPYCKLLNSQQHQMFIQTQAAEGPSIILHKHLKTSYTFITCSRVSFCDGSFYDDSLLRPLSNRTEHSRATMSQLECPFCTRCASSSVPLCMCFFFFYFSAVLLS